MQSSRRVLGMDRDPRMAPQHGLATRSRREAVQRVESYLRAHFDAPLRISGLSRVAGLSERGLRDAFYSVHGMSPKQWMLAERLKQVRSMSCCKCTQPFGRPVLPDEYSQKAGASRLVDSGVKSGDAR